jgi:hypothetical protein
LEETVKTDNFAEDEIDYQILRYSELRPRLVAASAAENNIMIEVVVINESCRAVCIFR